MADLRDRINALNPMTDCRWESATTPSMKLPKASYIKPIQPGMRITVKLGDIKLRADGRWDWWRWEKKWFPVWSGGQGVAATKWTAIFKVQDGWLSNVPLHFEDYNQPLPCDPCPIPAQRFSICDYDELRGYAMGARR